MVMVAPVKTDPAFSFGTPRMLFQGNYVSDIESRFILHGVLVGVTANLLALPLLMLFRLILPGALQLESVRAVWITIVFECALKICGSAAGAYVGGRRRKRLLSAEADKSPS